MSNDDVTYFLQVIPAYYLSAQPGDFLMMIRPVNDSYEHVKKILDDKKSIILNGACYDFGAEVTHVKEAMLKAAIFGMPIDFIEFCNRSWGSIKLQDAHTGEIIWDKSEGEQHYDPRDALTSQDTILK